MKQRFTVILLLAAAPWATFSAADAQRRAGDVLQVVLPATAGAVTLGHRDGKGARQLVESLALTLGVTYALKYGIDAKRPNGGGQSFPSGHTSVSFSAAEFMRTRYGWRYGLPSYAAASFVAYSRVASRYHHTRDVIAGAGIGVLSSAIFTRPYQGWQMRIEGDARHLVVGMTRRLP